MAVEIICNYNKFGFCKFGENCRKQHVNEICEEMSCDVRSCVQRHPRECKFYKEYQRCKFGEWCHFAHIHKETEMQRITLENENMQRKLSELENKMLDKDKVIEYILEKLRKMEEKAEKKEKKEKNYEQIDKHELTFYNPFLEVSKDESDCIEDIDYHESDSNVTNIEPEVQKLKCDLCSFETTYSSGLKTHVTKMHQEKNHYHYCERCEKSFENKKKLKEHIFCVHTKPWD